jgi:hypothetical protein
MTGFYLLFLIIFIAGVVQAISRANNPDAHRRRRRANPFWGTSDSGVSDFTSNDGGGWGDGGGWDCGDSSGGGDGGGGGGGD